MATSIYPIPAADSTVVEPYTMHVSSRYLDLTKKKLELTRMPREASVFEHERWAMGTPKAALEPLVDYWLESYDWRAQEAYFNSTLRQYRTVIMHPLQPPPSSSSSMDIDIEAIAADPMPQPEPLRVHFLHHRSDSATAIPLLYCHTWPGSFLEISRCIDALVNPIEPTPKQTQSGQAYRDRIAFHVVVPSTPGFGFSDASQKKDFGGEDTAAVFVRLMNRLGYERFVVWGDGWGFKIARMLATKYASNVAAVYTSHVTDIPAPQVLKHRDTWLKYQIARITGARFPWLSFGYTSSDFGMADITIADEAVARSKTVQSTEGEIELGQQTYKNNAQDRESGKQPIVRQGFPTKALSRRPQTLAYGLCDSPAGLLALLLDALKPTITHTAPGPISPRSQTRRRSATILQNRMSTIIENIPINPTFNPADVLNWTMMYWLPGPEAGLRWLFAMENENCYAEYSEVPLGISWYSTNTSGQLYPRTLRSPSSFEWVTSLSSVSSRKVDSHARSVQTLMQDTTGIMSPMWAAAVQNLKWVKRRKQELDSGVPAWEKSNEVVDDIREFFESGRNEGWLGL